MELYKCKISTLNIKFKCVFAELREKDKFKKEKKLSELKKEYNWCRLACKSILKEI